MSVLAFILSRHQPEFVLKGKADVWRESRFLNWMNKFVRDYKQKLSDIIYLC